MRSVVSPHIVLDREIAPFAAALLAGAAAAPAGVPIAEQRRHAALLRQHWTVGGPMMERRRDGIADTSRGPVGFRIHYPSRDDRLPTLVYLHGGGWTFLDLDTYDRVMRAFLEAAAVAEIRRRAIAEAGGWLATLAAPG